MTLLSGDMPAVDVHSSHMPSQLSQRPLFKSHKVLPHRKDVLSTAADVPVGSFFARDVKGEPADVHVVASAPALPLTPPGHRNDRESPAESSPFGDDLVPPIQSPLGIVTPTHPRSPPTPDITPPRSSVVKRPPLCQPLQSSLSSGAASFRTARETFSSDDELDGLEETPRLYSSQSVTTPGKRPSFPRHGISAELDRSLASESFVSAHQFATSSVTSEQGAEYCPDGTLHSEDDGVATPTRETHAFLPGASVGSPTHSSVTTVKEILTEDDVPVRRETSLRERVKDARQVESSASIEKFRADIGWPSVEERPTTAESPQSRRISMVSTSTIEAFIIDSPPPVAKTLRHTRKRPALRAVSSPLTRSEHASVISSAEPQSQHRLAHKAARITDQDRKSIASDMSIRTSVVSCTTQANIEVIPVVVIPQRCSSLKSSNPTSNAPSQSGSRQSSRRNTGLPGNRTSSLESSNRRHYIISKSVPAHTSDRTGKEPLSKRSVDRAISPSLSAAFSKTDSRTTSLTEESLRQHTQAMALDQQKRHAGREGFEPPEKLLDSPQETSRHPLPVHAEVDDAIHLRPPSLPFTQTSIQSSSPGPIEINEATAVSLFPHNNRSFLLVDQKVSPESRAVRAVRLGYRNELDGFTTPDGNPCKSYDVDVESPLRHPRAPPKPTFTLASAKLPAAPVDEDYRTRGTLAEPYESSHDSPVRRFTSLRRALSVGGPTTRSRRRSESFASFARSLSLRSVKDRKSAQQVDSKLNSFWRPRGFWDDIAEPPDEQRIAVGVPAPAPAPYENERKETTDQEDSPYLFIHNSLGMPQQRVIIPGPLGVAKRSPKLIAFVNDHHHGHSRTNLANTIARTSTPRPSLLRARDNDRFLSSSRWRIRLRSYNLTITIANLRRRLGRARLRREEIRRAARRERIKLSIGEVVLAE